MGLSMKTTSGKILASVALVGTAAAVAGMGTYGAFTDSTTAEQSVTAGTVDIDLLDPTALNLAMAGLLPGDSVEKLATLKNTGNSGLSAVTLTTSLPVGATPNALTGDSTLGLQLKIESCSTAWTGTAAPYTCTGSQSVLPASAIIGNGQARALTNLTSLTSGNSDFLKLTTSLPSGADNTFQGLTSTIKFDFTATQRTAQVK